MKKNFDSKTGLLWYFLKGSKRWFLLSAAAACLVSLFDLIQPRIIEFTVDSVIGDAKGRLPAFLNTLIENAGGVEYLRGHLYLIAAAVILLALAGGISRYLFRLFDSAGAERLVRNMRNSLFGHILSLPYSWYGQNHTGDIIQRCTSDVETIKVFMSEQLIQLFRVVLMITLSLYFMAGIHVQLTIASAVFIPIMVLSSIFFYGRIGNSFEKVDSEEGKLSSIAQENLTGIRVVRAFGRERYEMERFEKQNTYYTDLWIRLMRILSAFWVSGNVIATLRTLTIAVLGSVFCVQRTLTAGGFIAFISYNSLLSLPVRGLGRVITEMSRAGISLDRLLYIMNAQPEEEDENAECVPLDRDICFENVSFKYEGNTRDILKDITFTARAGTTMGILGTTGSGKSTIMYLLERLYELPEDGGRITIGGVDIRKISRKWLRKNIGIVLQEPYLFSRTLADNIRIADEDADMDEVRAAAQTAALTQSVEHFTDGYDTFVGERGVTLSGGEKQRTAIAQMLVRHTPVMIFDDSLSAVDAATDVKIREALSKEAGNATVFLIAHRITTLMNADRILVMDKGRIIEEGTHEELLAKNGLYRRVYEIQTQKGEEAWTNM